MATDPKQPPSGSSGTQTIVSGAWDIGSEMKLVYGSYDLASKTVFWSSPNPPAEKHFNFHSETVLDAPFMDSGVQKRFVVTATSPAGRILAVTYAIRF
jgi:hypothetical protein